MSQQPGLDELRQSLSSNDALDVVNAFIRIPHHGIPMMHHYWETRLCALAEFVLSSRKELVDALASVLDTHPDDLDPRLPQQVKERYRKAYETWLAAEGNT